MSELLFLVGNSNAGKDYICENKFKNFTNLKLNQSFKDVFEADHFLFAGACNNKNFRNEKLTIGPLRGLTIQEGMVLAYNQSLNNAGYGAKFRTSTILKTLEQADNLSKNKTPIAITDLRKTSELDFMFLFAKLIGYSTRMILIKSTSETPQESDRFLIPIMNLYQNLSSSKIEVCLNNRDN